MPVSLPRIAVVIACHNRRAQTLACLNGLHAGNVDRHGQAIANLQVILVDDGSSDGTATAVSAAFPSTAILRGDGNLFWNRAMHWGLTRARVMQPDYYLWLNDDVRLNQDVLARLLATEVQVSAMSANGVIVVGSTADQTGRRSYGGALRTSAWRRFHFAPVFDAEQPIACTVLNGNCVLIPAAVFERVGNLDPAFEHAMGDTDYALRAHQAGVGVWLAPGFIGTCGTQPVVWQDTARPINERWANLRSRKGLPPQSWWHFTRRHAGWLAPLYFLSPYVKFWIQAARQRLRRQTS